MITTPTALRATPLASPPVSARAVVVMNPDTGEIIFAKQPYQPLPPASTTKVLTTLLALERLDPNSRIAVSVSAADTPPSRIGLHPGERMTAQDLLYGVMLKSGNDAAEVIAEAIGGSVAGFSRLMNARAHQIGAHHTHFNNPHGLPDDNHYSTAYDLALIFRYAMHHPMFAEIVQTRNASLRIEAAADPDGWRLVSVRNTNRLLGSFEGTRGGKTGYTRKARRCFVGEVSRGKTRLIVAVLGSNDLWQDITTLFDHGFAHYGYPLPARPPVAVTPARVTAVKYTTTAKQRATAAKKRTTATKPATATKKRATTAKPATAPKRAKQLPVALRGSGKTATKSTGKSKSAARTQAAAKTTPVSHGQHITKADPRTPRKKAGS